MTMLNARTFALLKKVIATIPHDNRGAFKESDLIETLAEKLPAFLPHGNFGGSLASDVAMIIVNSAMDDDGTPADGMLHLSTGEYPWLPDQLLSDGNGYLIRQADATLEFTQRAAKVARP